MAYNKSDNSNKYNKEERGGWYCTNPKKHDELEQHHSADEPHVHRAERNDKETVRQPESKAKRTDSRADNRSDSHADNATGKPKHRDPFDIPDWSKPQEPAPAKRNKKSCLGCMIVLFFMPFFTLLIGLCAVDTDETMEYDETMIEYDETSESDSPLDEPDSDAEVIEIEDESQETQYL